MDTGYVEILGTCPCFVVDLLRLIGIENREDKKNKTNYYYSENNENNFF